MKTNPAERAEAALRAVALGYPEAYEDHPWGDTVFKVKGKVFVFMGAMESGEFGISTKLPLSNAVALMLPFAEPTRYGLGKSGWVSARFAAKEEVPLDMLTAWIDESYRAVAPKKLVAGLPKVGSPPAKEPPAEKAAPPVTKKAMAKPATNKAAARPATNKAAAKPGTKSAPPKAEATRVAPAAPKKAATSTAKKATPAAKNSAAKPATKKAPAKAEATKLTPAAPKKAAKKAPPKRPAR